MRSKEIRILPEDLDRRSEIERLHCKSRRHDVREIELPIEIVQNPMNSHCLYMVQRNFNKSETSSLHNEIKYAKKRLNAKSKHLLKYHDFTSFNNMALDNMHSVRHFIDPTDPFLSTILLNEEAEGRLSDLRIASSSSVFLTKLLYAIIDAGSALQEVGLAHGRICPQVITIKEPCTIKLVDNFRNLCCTQETNQYLSELRLEYMSPEFYSKLKKKEKASNLNLVKNDVFCLGLVILELATGTSIKGFLNQDGTFNESIYISSIQEFKRIMIEKNNRLLASTVSEELLQLDSSLRRDFTTIKKRLPKYEDIEKYLQEHEMLDPNASWRECSF